MSDEKNVSIAPEDVVDRTVDNGTAALTDAIGIVVPGVSSEPSKTEKEKTDDEKKEEAA